MAKTRSDKDKGKEHEEDFKNRNNVIEKEMNQQTVELGANACST